VTFRERIDIGPTNLTPQEVQDVVQEMGDTYKGNAYHLLQRCAVLATFSAELAEDVCCGSDACTSIPSRGRWRWALS